MDDDNGARSGGPFPHQAAQFLPRPAAPCCDRPAVQVTRAQGCRVASHPPSDPHTPSAAAASSVRPPRPPIWAVPRARLRRHKYRPGPRVATHTRPRRALRPSDSSVAAGGFCPRPVPSASPQAPGRKLLCGLSGVVAVMRRPR
eukprot:scaffold3767_cov242-Prasinococcus_capsulatus_cf.AAC.3